MLSYTLLAGLLTASTFASPVERIPVSSTSPAAKIPAALERRGGVDQNCDAVVLNSNDPDDYCYRFCDLETTHIIASKPELVSDHSDCPKDGPDGGCPITVSAEASIEVSSTETHGTKEVVVSGGGAKFKGFNLFEVDIGVSYQHWIESSKAITKGKTTTSGVANTLYVPKGKTGQVLFFPFMERHCGPSAQLRKPNLLDEKDFDCNADYNIIIKNGGKLDGIRGMQYDYDGIHEGDIYREGYSCHDFPVVDVKGHARGQFQ
ncbi:hypothetical protein V494_08177, partial [Pseudogymnoascus sp. VKM F-4513 (FW-928)]